MWYYSNDGNSLYTDPLFVYFSRVCVIEGFFLVFLFGASLPGQIIIDKLFQLLNFVPVNVDEWLQSASADNGDDEDNNNAQGEAILILKKMK